MYFEQRTGSGAGPDTWCLWARCELEGGFLDHVLPIMKKALDKWPDHVGLILVAGDAAEALMDQKGVVDQLTMGYFEKSADILSDRSDTRLRYAVGLFQAGKYPESEREFCKALRLLPDYLSPTYFCHYWVDETGTRKQFSGKVVRQEDKWTVRSGNLLPIHISKGQIERGQISQGQMINFYIAFNYYGPAALIV